MTWKTGDTFFKFIWMLLWIRLNLRVMNFTKYAPPEKFDVTMLRREFWKQAWENLFGAAE